MMYLSHSFAILAIFGSVLRGVMAGPGVLVEVCINLQTKPSEKVTFSFDPRSSDNKCMNSIGNTASLDVSESGMSCVGIGYVEAKTSSSGGDTCASDQSIWNIAYSGTLNTNKKSGTIKSRWRKQWGSQTNEIVFQSAPGTARVCGSKHLCNSRDYYWETGTSGPAYFIFQPDIQNDLTTIQEPELVIQAGST